jgi:hypothetical protein
VLKRSFGESLTTVLWCFSTVFSTKVLKTSVDGMPYLFETEPSGDKSLPEKTGFILKALRHPKRVFQQTV